ncbi:MAG: hypothetical protein WC509_05155 [Candidatus Izemoplasmatales bacterium]
MRARLTPRNILLYVLGIACISFGVVLSFRTGFGGNPGDTLTAVLSTVTGLTFGLTSAIICAVYILFLSVFFRTWKFTFLVAQVAIFSPIADFWGLVVLKDFHPTGAAAWVAFAVSALAIPLGSSILIRTKLPAGIFDELMFFTAHVTKFKLSAARTLNESLIVGLAIAIGYLSGNGLGAVGLGTIAYALSVGWILKGILLLSERIFPGRETT